jgi:hypothetical protein
MDNPVENTNKEVWSSNFIDHTSLFDLDQKENQVEHLDLIVLRFLFRILIVYWATREKKRMRFFSINTMFNDKKSCVILMNTEKEKRGNETKEEKKRWEKKGRRNEL